VVLLLRLAVLLHSFLLRLLLPWLLFALLLPLLRLPFLLLMLRFSRVSFTHKHRVTRIAITICRTMWRHGSCRMRGSGLTATLKAGLGCCRKAFGGCCYTVTIVLRCLTLAPCMCLSVCQLLLEGTQQCFSVLTIAG
jgi:hypothetical protein